VGEVGVMGETGVTAVTGVMAAVVKEEVETVPGAKTVASATGKRVRG
jgi:hypothetical protein